MKSYIKFLSRNKLYTAVEAVGLTVSIAFVILIGNYVLQQHRVARESPHWERTFVLVPTTILTPPTGIKRSCR